MSDDEQRQQAPCICGSERQDPTCPAANECAWYMVNLREWWEDDDE